MPRIRALRGARRRAGLAPVSPFVTALLVGVLLCSTTACVSSEHVSRDWTTYDGPGARYFQAEEIEFPHTDDPLEPVNRVSAFANYAILRWILAPLTRLYAFFVPLQVREHVAKAGENFLFPTRFVNNLLQGKLEEAGVEASRFAVNTTVGVLGLFDPAQSWGLHPYPEDFGQTFASWGWTGGTYLFLPILGPSTVRDGLGELPDAATDPATYFFPAAQLRGFNSLSTHVDADLRTIESAYDAYEPGRTLYTLQREVDVEDFVWQEDDSAPTQTLGAIFLKPEDPGFPRDARTRRVHLSTTGSELPYELWLQPEPAPLMYVLPGFGGNRLAASAAALAEIGFAQGHSVVAVSSPTNWEFMRHAASVAVPGYGPVDAHDLHVALTAIDRQLEARYPGHFEERRVVGISIGAYEALWMACDEDRPVDGDPEAGLLEFDLCLALNPPVSIEHALLQLDAFYNAPLSFPAEERAERVEQIFAKVLYLSHGALQPGEELPFSELEAPFLIGLAFRLDLQYVILQSQDLEDSGVLLTPRSPLHMAPAFREAAEYSYMEYLFAFVLPYYAKRDAEITFDEDGARRLFERSDLRILGPALAANDRVRIFTNENDFLLRPEDLDWLRESLGDRLSLFEDGGHLGSLYRDIIRSAIADTLSEGSSAPPAD